jgi:methyl-accepting chemotaxis protein
VSTVVHERLKILFPRSSMIAVAVNEQGARDEEIARGVQQASQATSTVASNVNGLQRGCKETGVAWAEMSFAASSLSTGSNRLKNQVGSVLMTVRAA